MIETVAIQDEMTQQTSLLDHSEEQVQQEMETITKMHMGPVIHRKYQQNQTILVALVSNSLVLILRFSGNWYSWFSMHALHI
jgi:hypothetical protein